MYTYFIEIPHQLPPKAYAYETASLTEELNKLADGASYHTKTLEDLQRDFGDEDIIPEEALSILREHPSLVEATMYDAVQYFPPDKAPTEIQWLGEFLFGDSHYWSFDTDPTRLINRLPDHQRNKAELAILTVSERFQ